MPKPLDGTIVLETASFVSGPYVGLLADLGADVIKIENPKGGDPFRHPNGYSSEFQAYNPNKRSVALDITTPAGADVLRRLIGRADVLVHNFRPGVMERLGFGWENVSPLNERLIYCSLTGFGHDGPYQHRPSYGFRGRRAVRLPQPIRFGERPANCRAGGVGRHHRPVCQLWRARCAGRARPHRPWLPRRCHHGRGDDRLPTPALRQFLLVGSDAVSTGKARVLLLLRPGLRRRQDARDPHFLAAEVLEALLSVMPDCKLGTDPRFDTRAKRIENFVALTEEAARRSPSALRRAPNGWRCSMLPTFRLRRSTTLPK